MARVIIETAGEDVIVGGDDVVVNGTASGSETVTIVGGNVTLDASFAQGGDTIILAGDASGYTATRVGSRLILTNGTTTISIPLSPNETEIEFGDGDVRTLSLVDGEIVLGGQVLDGEGETVITPPEDTSLLDALAALQDAEEDLADFLDDEETDAESIRDAVDEAEADLADDVDEDGSYAQLEAALEAAEAYWDAAQEDMDAVDGLEEALERTEAAYEEGEAALDSLIQTQAGLAGALAEFEVLNGGVEGGTTIFPEGSFLFIDLVDWNGEVTADGDVVLTVEDGEIVIDEDWEDAPGVEALAEAMAAQVGAMQAFYASMYEAQEAEWELYMLDSIGGTEEEAEAFAAFREAARAYAVALEALADELEETEGDPSQSVQNDLEEAYFNLFGEELEAEEIWMDQGDIEGEIAFGFALFQDMLSDEYNENPVLEDYWYAEGALGEAEDNLAERDDLLAALEDAEALLAVLEDHEQDLEDARGAFEALGYEEPVTLEAETQFEGTNGSDIFLYAGLDNAWVDIYEFGEDGEDILYVGPGYSLEVVEDWVENEAAGDFDELEIFAYQDGDWLLLYVEDKTFAGNEADGDFSGDFIWLNGVDVEDIVLNADGTITLDTGAEAAAGWQSIAADNGFA